jgi:glycosyltransferase involved in cell wall biosynthesis
MYGAERWILALAKHLPAKEVQSWIAVIKDDPALDAPLCEQAEKLGLSTEVFESFGRFNLSAVWKLRGFICGNDVHILHTHGYKTDIIGCLAVQGTRCKLVVTPHGWGASSGLKLRLYETIDRLFLPLASAVVPLSSELYDGLCRYPSLSRRLHLIENGVDLSELDVTDDAAEPLISWRTGGDFVVGYVGRLDRGKRIETLIRAFARLAISGKRLCIVGEGPERERLQRLASELAVGERVGFLGFREDRLELMRGFHAFVLPSEHEGIPRCLMEAMALGVAVVASDIPGCRNLVEDGISGLLFAVGDESLLAQQVLRLAESPALRTELAQAGRQCVRAKYSAEVMASRYFSLYSDLIRTRQV